MGAVRATSTYLSLCAHIHVYIYVSVHLSIYLDLHRDRSVGGHVCVCLEVSLGCGFFGIFVVFFGGLCVCLGFGLLWFVLILFFSGCLFVGGLFCFFSPVKVDIIASCWCLQLLQLK